MSGGFDRRWLFLGMAVAVALPLLLPIPDIAGPVQAESTGFFERIDGLPTGRPILLSLDYSPDTAPEVEPIAVAALRHAAHRDIPAVLFTVVEDNQGQAESLMRRLLAEGMQYGTDLVFLGFRPEIRPLIISMQQDLRANFPVDYEGTPLDQLPLTAGIRRLPDFSLVLSVASDDVCLDWIAFGANRYGTPLAMGVSANLYGTVKPFVDSGEVLEVLRGMKGAAEYERVLVDRQVLDQTGDGVRGMGSQSLAHLWILALIVLGNLTAWRHRARRRSS